MTNIAAIDIGSNALRAVIARISDSGITLLKNYRVPLRLGQEVFQNNGIISAKKIKATENAFLQIVNLLNDFDVTQTKACATSALRDAKNAQTLIRRIKKNSGIAIKIINGIQEAKLIYKAVNAKINLKNRIVLLIDIGGGSTEITLSKNAKILASHSFNLGTVRLLKEKNIKVMESIIEEEVFKIEKYLRNKMKVHKTDFAVGTGGNLRRMGKLRKKILRKASDEVVTQKDITQIYQKLITHTFEERMRLYNMGKDRADVIVPATYIINTLLTRLHLNTMYVPNVGLKEGILLSMLKKNPKRLTTLKDS